MRESEELKNFDRTMQQLMNVPHSQIKAALEAEKTTKKKRKAKKPSASGHVEDDTD